MNGGRSESAQKMNAEGVIKTVILDRPINQTLETC